MTIPQWLFHYYEIHHNRLDHNKEIYGFNVELVKTALEIISDKLDMVAAVAATNPDVGKQILQHKELAKARAQIDEDQFGNQYKDLKKVIPDKLFVALPNKDKGALPKINRDDFKRKYGIFKEGDKR